MRYVIYGAGAVGCAIGGALHLKGHDVTLIGRGAHLQAIQSEGLSLQTSDASDVLRIPAVASPEEAEITPDTAVFLAMKSQDTEDAVRSLASVAPRQIAVVCSQNGVENERVALRRFFKVYGMATLLPATFIEPGVVQNFNAPAKGLLDVGCFPSGSDAVAERIAADLTDAGFSSRAVPDIMRWKYTKLLRSARTSVQAFCPPGADLDKLVQALADEAESCLRSAGVDFASDQEDKERRRDLMKRVPPKGVEAPGRPSLWQSLERNVGSLESDYFNGEIVLLGRLHGVPCHLNQAVQELSNELARSHAKPGGLDPDLFFQRAREIADGSTA